MVPVGHQIKNDLSIKRNGAGNYYKTPLKLVVEHEKYHLVNSRQTSSLSKHLSHKNSLLSLKSLPLSP